MYSIWDFYWSSRQVENNCLRAVAKPEAVNEYHKSSKSDWIKEMQDWSTALVLESGKFTHVNLLNLSIYLWRETSRDADVIED